MLSELDKALWELEEAAVEVEESVDVKLVNDDEDKVDDKEVLLVETLLHWVVKTIPEVTGTAETRGNAIDAKRYVRCIMKYLSVFLVDDYFTEYYKDRRMLKDQKSSQRGEGCERFIAEQ